MEQTLGTVEKALDILQHLHASPGALGVTEIGRALELPKSTAHRLLTTLARRGMVERSAQGRYQPGIALVALGVGLLDREPVVVAARPVIESLASELGETIFLAGLRGGRLYVLDKQEGEGFLRAAPQVGSEVPVHATAIGKIFLALAADELDDDAELATFTPATLRDVALQRDLERVRTTGMSEQRDEWIEGLSGIAAPLWLRGRLVGALAVSGPSARFDDEQSARYREHLGAATAQIERRLGGKNG